VTNATPWWGTLLLGIVGVAGVVMTQVLTNLREEKHARAARVEARRAERVLAYADLCRAVGLSMEVMRGEPSPRRFFEVMEVVNLATARVRLLGPEPVAVAGERALAAVVALGDLDEDDDDKAAKEAVDRASTQMMDVMRRAIADSPPAPPVVLRSTI
jgi:hypothetical protein